MGYYAKCSKSKIRITDESAALTALKEANAKKSLTDAEEFGRSETNSERLARASSFDDALGLLFWEVRRGPNGAIVGLAFDFTFDELEHEAIFNALAPFIAGGSYLVIEGEDETCWRTTFEKGRATTGVTSINIGLEVTESRVGIVDEAAALSALRERHERDPLQPGDDSLLRASTLDEALECFEWSVVRDGDGNVTALTGDWAPLVTEEKTVLDMIQSDQLLATLAPFVTDESYVIIEGEAELRWKVSFQAGRVREKEL